MRSKLQENISEGGFTLLELIIVLILVSILSAISTPLFKSFIRKVHSAAGKTSITNIKKECTTNKDLQVQEIFTPIETRGYSIHPISFSSCFGDVKNNLISLIPNDTENPIYTYNHLLEKINTINPRPIQEKAFLKNYSVPFVQLEPKKTILVFSHIHNSYDKKKLLDNPHPKYHAYKKMFIDKTKFNIRY